MKKELKAMEAAHDKYTSAISAFHDAIADKVDFEFFVFWQPGDGFVIADNEMGNGQLDKCLEIIAQKGRLTYEDYRTTLI